ncbi:MAG: inositol monophosphatase [Dehalococcoidia bacterium]|nr:inositol monophosphatase [Dehalococcoidia bacterium]
MPPEAEPIASGAFMSANHTSLPSPEELSAIRAEAVQLATDAGGLVMDYFRRGLDARYKGKDEHNPVTEADEAAESLIRDGILARFPDHAVLGEEADAIAGNAASPYLWAIDPLDGTLNFLNGLALFAVSVGVLHEGQAIAGAIFVPSGLADMPVVLSAAAGLGASLGDIPIDRTARTAIRARLGTVPGGGRRGRHGRPPEGLRLGEPRSLGSIAIELALVAMGTLQYAMFSAPRLWDVAAGALIVQEAGGTALVRGRRGWAPLARYEGAKDAATAAEGYRHWCAPLVAGDENAANYFTGLDTPSAGTLRTSLGRLLRGG